jgi:hypothetical protein
MSTTTKAAAKATKAAPAKATEENTPKYPVEIINAYLGENSSPKADELLEALRTGGYVLVSKPTVSVQIEPHNDPFVSFIKTVRVDGEIDGVLIGAAQQIAPYQTDRAEPGYLKWVKTQIARDYATELAKQLGLLDEPTGTLEDELGIPHVG